MGLIIWLLLPASLAMGLIIWLLLQLV
jgi:hypothetical protein